MWNLQQKNPLAPAGPREVAAKLLKFLQGPSGFLRRTQEDLAAIQQLTEEIKSMSTTPDPITAYTTQINSNLTLLGEAVNNLAGAVTSLDAQIAALQSQLSASGALSATDAAALQAVVDASGALVTQANAIPLPPAVAPAAPATPSAG